MCHPKEERLVKKTVCSVAVARGVFRILTPMEKINNAPKGQNNILVVYGFVFTVILLVIGAIILIAWRGKQAKAPYATHPTSQLSHPVTPSKPNLRA